jgi:hypothetical protein
MRRLVHASVKCRVCELANTFVHVACFFNSSPEVTFQTALVYLCTEMSLGIR